MTIINIQYANVNINNSCKNYNYCIVQHGVYTVFTVVQLKVGEICGYSSDVQSISFNGGWMSRGRI